MVRSTGQSVACPASVRSDFASSVPFALLLTTVFILTFFILCLPASVALTQVNGCMNLSLENETYLLASQLAVSGNCFNVTANNVTFIGAGNILPITAGPVPSFADDIFNASGVTDLKIQNLTIDGSMTNLTAIDLSFVKRATISNLSLANNSIGVHVLDSSAIVIQNISATSNNWTIMLARVNNSNISLLTINDSSHMAQIANTNTMQNTSLLGIYLMGSDISNIQLSGNTNTTVSNIYTNASTSSLLLAVDTSSQIALRQFNISQLDISTTTLFNATQGTINGYTSSPAITIHADNLTFANITIGGYSAGAVDLNVNQSYAKNISFANITFLNQSAADFFSNSTWGSTDNVSVNFVDNSATQLTNISLNGLGIRFNYTSGAANKVNLVMTQPVNSSTNLSANLGIGAGGANTAFINESVQQLAQKYTATFFGLATNYISQKLLRDGLLCQASCPNLTPLNQSSVSFSLNASGNYSLVDLGSAPPGTVSNLNATSAGNNNIVWNWTNPADIDFNGTQLLLNGAPLVNLSANIAGYNATNLLDNTSYTLTVRTVDVDGNVNNTPVANTTRTLADVIPPSAVGALNTTIVTRSQLTFNWTLPVDTDYAYLTVRANGVVMLNNTNATNISFAPILPNSSVLLNVTAVDVNGNANSTVLSAMSTDDEINSTTITQCGTIYKPGSYIIGAPILVSNYTCLYVRGQNISVDGNGSTIISSALNATSNASGIIVDSAVNVTLSNLILYSDASSLRGRGITIANGTLVAFNNMTLFNLSIGLNLTNSNGINLTNSTVRSVTTGAIFTFAKSNNVTFWGDVLQNMSSAFILSTGTAVNLTNVAIVNATKSAINISVGGSAVASNVTINETNAAASANILDAYGTLQLQNVSVATGSAFAQNISTANFSGYTLDFFAGNVSITRRNYASVMFPLISNFSNVDPVNDVTLGNNSLFVDSGVHPQYATGAVITFYNIFQGQPVAISNSGAQCNSASTPACYAWSLLSGPTVVFNTSLLNGSFSVQGFTLRLISPANDTNLSGNQATFVFSISPSLGHAVTGCNMSIDAPDGTFQIRQYNFGAGLINTQQYTYAYSNLSNTFAYNWTVSCYDNYSFQAVASGNFTSGTSTSSSTSSNSGGAAAGAFGAYPGLDTWVNTYAKDSDNLAAPLNMGLRIWEGVRIRVDNQSHFVGVVSVSDTYAVINFSSTPQQATLSIGSSQAFTLDDGDAQKVIVTLNSIDAGVANLTITPSNIATPATITGQTDSASASAASGANETTSSVGVNSSAAAAANTQTQQTQVQSEAPPALFAAGQQMLGVGAVVALILVGVGVYIVWGSRKQKSAGPKVKTQKTHVMVGGVKVAAQSSMPVAAQPIGGAQSSRTAKAPNVPTMTRAPVQITSQDQDTQNKSAKKSKTLSIAQFLPFLQNKPAEPQPVQTVVDPAQVRKEREALYARSVTPLVDMKLALFIRQRLDAGSSPSLIEFELIENGYSREQATQAMSYLKTDKYIRDRFMAGATVEQLKAELAARGWPQNVIATIFRSQ